MRFMPRLFDACVDFLFPKSKKILEIERLSPDEILRILPSAAPIDDNNVVALFDYSNPLVREIIWSIKYRGDQTIADKLGEILADTIEHELAERNLFERFENPLLIPMPISDKRRFERGWNQAELLAKAVKKKISADTLKYQNGQLVKHRHTESQTQTASKSERQNNLKNSMKIMDPEIVRGHSIVLLDDVITTGSTFAEAKRVLREAGAKKILCVAVAH